MESLSFILGLGVNPFPSRVINRTPLVGVSKLKAQSAQNYDSAIVLRYITQQTRITESFSRLAMEMRHLREKAILKINILGKVLIQ